VRGNTLSRFQCESCNRGPHLGGPGKRKNRRWKWGVHARLKERKGDTEIEGGRSGRPRENTHNALKTETRPNRSKPRKKGGVAKMVHGKAIARTRYLKAQIAQLTSDGV